ncbi:MAG: hypothetical protein ABFD46_06320 [Armatimonadota bacterium]
MEEIAGLQGYELEIAGGWIFEIGNEWITRRVQCIAGRIGTTSLAHGASIEEYLEEPIQEFAITLSRDGNTRELSFRDFHYTGHSVPHADETERLLRIDLEAELNGVKLPLSVFYQVRAGQNFMQKWIEIPPVNLPGWVIEWVTLENLRFRDVVEGISPHSRYLQTFSNGEDNVHSEADKADVESPASRFDFGDHSRAIVTRWGVSEGLFFFVSHILGSETFDRASGLLMRQKEYTPLTEGLRTGQAVIGAYSGPAEIGFKRYREYLEQNWCVVGDKPLPVMWNTWLVTQSYNRPVESDYDRNMILDYLNRMNDAGFYDTLHLDLGWESRWPMAPSPDKFPNGLDEIVRRACDFGIDMSFWVNPFSSSYWMSDIEDEHPEWLNPDKTSARSSAHAICPMTDYFDYAKRRFVELVTRYNARNIYWDGGDWNIARCSAEDHNHKNQHELEVRATKRLVELTAAVREARSDAMVTAFSLPFDNHRLSALDRQQVSDTHSFPTGKSELIQRQQIYQMTFEHPYRAIWGSWYGVNWQEAGENNLSKPLHELIHAEMSMIGNGASQSGASIDLAQAKPEFVEFLRLMFEWRKKFERYFTVYQHILGFPDGENIDGEGHIIDGKGFIILINPTNQEKSINLPLDEPELETSVGYKYKITDWSRFKAPRMLGKMKVGDKLELDFAPLEVKIIGVDVAERI